MHYSEFKQKLGADPTSQDPEFLRARNSSPEFVRAALESDRFEQALRRAARLPAPVDLLPQLKKISQANASRQGTWKYYAMAASLFLAIAAAGIGWRMRAVHFDSVEQYVAQHYFVDGPELLAQSEGRVADNVAQLLALFEAEISPDVRRMVGAIKICPTPDGNGVHFVLNTERGPITVIFMPRTPVTDGEMVAFDGMEAQLVTLEHGSAAIIGKSGQKVSDFYTLVHDSITPSGASA